MWHDNLLFTFLFLSWTGYKKYFVALRNYLLAAPELRGRLVEVVGREDPTITGNFEVTVVGTGTVLHSKRHHPGQRRCETEVERRALLDRILALLDAEA